MIPALIAVALPLPAPGAGSAASNLSADLDYASAEARGARLCDRRLAARQKHRFDALYGARIAALQRAYLKWHGPDEDHVVVSDCLGSVNRAALRARIANALRAFGPRLDALEARYARP